MAALVAIAAELAAAIPSRLQFARVEITLTDTVCPAIQLGNPRLLRSFFSLFLRVATMSELDPFGGPFNGQAGRVAIVDELFRTASFQAIVETGTFTGSTTEFFLRQTSLPVHSVEMDRDRAQMAALRLKNYEQARLSCGDSRGFLRQLADDREFPQERVFFYLDAHWNEDLPLREEVELITSRWRNSVVMIDDFQVPDDVGYQFDSYTETCTLRLEYLDCQLASLPVFFPAIPSRQETGHRRGCVVFGTDQATGQILDAVKRLRRWGVEGAGNARGTGTKGTGTILRKIEPVPGNAPVSNHESMERSGALQQGLITRSDDGDIGQGGQAQFSEKLSQSPATRYLLVKAHVGFGDRLQALSHAIQYAQKYQRTLCVDWTDGIWSDGTLDFDTYFDLCGVPMISSHELYRLSASNISPLGWANQLERTADSKFLYRPAYQNPLLDSDHAAEILVYGSTSDRTYYRDNLNLLRVKRPFRDLIVAELKKYKSCQRVVHLRGTDRRKSASYEDYMLQIANKMEAGFKAKGTGTFLGKNEPVPGQKEAVPENEPFLVVTDSLPLFEQLQSRYPNAVLRTPHLDQFDALQGTHFQSSIPKHEYNLQMLIDFFLLVYAPECISDGESYFSIMARFLHDGDHSDILGYDG